MLPKGTRILRAAGIVARRYSAPIVILALSLVLSWNTFRVEDLVGVDKKYYYGDKILGTYIEHLDSMITPDYMRSLRDYYSPVEMILYVVAYGLVKLRLPLTIYYPFLYYLLLMTSMYILLSSILRNKALRVLGAFLYASNPVTISYYPAFRAPFSLTIIPLITLYFHRTLVSLRKGSSFDAARNILVAAILAYVYAALHLQAILVAAYIYSIIAAIFVAHSILARKGSMSALSVVRAVALFTIAFTLASLPLAYSVLSSTKLFAAPTVYLSGIKKEMARRDFLYAYAPTGINALRLAGDQSTRSHYLGYDNETPLMLSGYVYPLAATALAILLIRRGKRLSCELRIFSYIMLSIYFISVATILLIKAIIVLDKIDIIAGNVFFQNIRSPIKLRAYGMFAAITILVALADIIAVQQEELTSRSLRAYRYIIIVILLGLAIAYSYPAMLNQLKGLQNLHPNRHYTSMVDWITAFTAPNERGIILPYDHLTELYSPPWFRLLPFYSTLPIKDIVNTAYNTGVGFSDSLRLLSIDYIILDKKWWNRGWAILVAHKGVKLNKLAKLLDKDKHIKEIYESDQYSVYRVDNSLPKLYTTKRLVVYNGYRELLYALKELGFSHSGEGVAAVSVEEIRRVIRKQPEISTVQLRNTTIIFRSEKSIDTKEKKLKIFNKMLKNVERTSSGYYRATLDSISLGELGQASLCAVATLQRVTLQGGEKNLGFYYNIDLRLKIPKPRKQASLAVVISDSRGERHIDININSTHIKITRILNNSKQSIKTIPVAGNIVAIRIQKQQGELIVTASNMKTMVPLDSLKPPYTITVKSRGGIRIENLLAQDCRPPGETQFALQGTLAFGSLLVYQYTYNKGYRVKGDVNCVNEEPILVNGYSNGWLITGETRLDKVAIVFPYNKYFLILSIISCIFILRTVAVVYGGQAIDMFRKVISKLYWLLRRILGVLLVQP